MVTFCHEPVVGAKPLSYAGGNCHGRTAMMGRTDKHGIDELLSNPLGVRFRCDLSVAFRAETRL